MHMAAFEIDRQIANHREFQKLKTSLLKNRGVVKEFN